MRVGWICDPARQVHLEVKKAEIELSALSSQCLRRRIEILVYLEREVQAWAVKRNAAQVRINWQFWTSDARIKLRRLYPELKSQNFVS
jgi:hypothetical protein